MARRDEDPALLTKKEKFGSNAPSATDVKKYEGEETKKRIYDTAIAGGASEAEASAAVKGSGIGSVTPRLDKMAYDEEQRQQRLATEGAGAPPKRDLRVEQLIRSFKGQAPLAETPLQFAAQVETSKGYGEKSALLTPAGKARATESAIAAGLSPTEAQAQINAATASLLKDVSEKARITKGLTESPTPDYGIGVFKPAGKAATPVEDKPDGTPAPAPTAPPKPLIIPEQPAAEEAQKPQGVLPDGLYAGTANVLGKAATTAVESVGANAAKTAEALKQASLPRLGSGTTTAADDAAAVLNKVKDVAKANLNAKQAEIVAKVLGPASRVGGALSSLGKLAGKANKAKEIYHGIRFYGDKEYQDETIKEMEDFGERGRKAFGSEGTAGDKLSYVGDSLAKGPDMIKTLFSLGALQTQNRRSQEDAAAAEKAADKAQVLFNARAKARRANISDEDFKALPPKERFALMDQIRKAIK